MNLFDTKQQSSLEALSAQGQSVWLDYIRRSLITSGELARMIEADRLKGLTSNPAIFEKAISESSDYDDELKELRDQHQDAATSYETIAIRDIQDAADAFFPVYDQSNCRDGYVSLEVSPHLARDQEGTLNEARRLWRRVARENLMIKVPATPEGIPAIEQLIREGINVNVTLIFSLGVHQAVMEAFLAGLEKRVAEGGNIEKVAGVASFFVSRIDTAVDDVLEKKQKQATSVKEREQISSIIGKVAIANAKLAYQNYLETFNSARWNQLASAGGQTQRVLWASTGTKNPSFSDVIYVEELIGQDTVNTIPPSTLNAFRDHGQVRASLLENLNSAKTVLQNLQDVGVSLDDVTDELLQNGLLLFSNAFDKLLAAVGDCECNSESNLKA